jgi:hypothetical protein
LILSGHGFRVINLKVEKNELENGGTCCFSMWNGFRTINILLGSASIIAATAVWRYRSQGKLTILPKTRPDFSLASLMVSARSG